LNLTRAVRKMRPLGSPLFRPLAKCKRLRGTAFGLFGYTAERKLKRRVIADY
jgi:indolepyruvate ferredoxin oxidoreductase